MSLRRLISPPVVQDMIAILVIFLACLPIYILDVIKFYTGAERWLTGLSIYQHSLESSYYPFFTYLLSLFVLPFRLAGLSRPAAEVALPLSIWEVLPVKLLLLTAHLITYGLLLYIAKGWNRSLRWFFAFNPLILLVSFIIAQTDEVIAPFLLAILILDARKRDFWADAGIGVLLGLAASIKVWPVLLLPWLLFQRRAHFKSIIALLTGLLIAVAVNLVYFLFSTEGLAILWSDSSPIGLRYPWKIRGTNPLLIHPIFKDLYQLPLFKFLLQVIIVMIPFLWWRKLSLLDTMSFIAGASTLLLPEVADYRFVPFVVLLALGASLRENRVWEMRLLYLYGVLPTTVMIVIIAYFWLFYPYLQSAFGSPLNFPLATQSLAQAIYPAIETGRAWIGLVLLVSIALWFRNLILTSEKSYSEA